MEGFYRISRILSCFMMGCLLFALSACQTVPTPGENDFTAAADALTYPKRVALLLPLQGDLKAQGQAVRDGFFAAYYVDAKTRSTGLPAITVIDTQGDRNILNAYQKALAQGAEFIVGPLTKPALEILMKAGDPRVPILALNSLDLDSKVLYQFGLSPEDEAFQAAKVAYANGKRSALLFIQEGSWGRRVASAFKAAFNREGGEIREVVFFSTRDNLSEVVKSALHITEAEMAAMDKAMRTKTAAPFVLKPRDDVDMVFMAAMPFEARQIPPLLRFYFAGYWPVYATASVYNGAPNPKADHDLDGVTFCDIPWVIETPRHHKMGTPDDAVVQLWPSEPRPQMRLYAMGVDAYEIIPMLPRMAAQRNLAFDGATGVLTLDDEQQVQRTLPCTQFVRGVPAKVSDRAQ